MSDKPTYKVNIYLERVTPPSEGDTDAEPTYAELFNHSSSGHTTLHAAFQSGIGAMIAGRQQRDKEAEDYRGGKLAALGLIGQMLRGEPEQEDSNPFPNSILCGTPQAHASGLDEAPTFTKEELSGVAADAPGVPGINPEALGLIVGNAQSVQDAEPLPTRERAETPAIPSKHYKCDDECRVHGHMPPPGEPVTVVREGNGHQAQPGERVVTLDGDGVILAVEP